VRGLYPILDVQALTARGIDPLAFADAVLSAHPPILQLRSKLGGARDPLSLLRELLPRCRRVKTLLYANDRPDLALLAGADGVHLGQNDVPAEALREFAPGLGFGLSTHDLAELDQALAERPNYVAFGPVFATQSKQDPERVVGSGLLREAGLRARSAGIPLVAIGGIDLERASEVAEHADLGSVIGALAHQDARVVLERALALNRIFGGERPA
jgi:thiamine-phosphate pyrophosphorylase